MPKIKRKRKKKPTEPDEFITFSQRAIAWAKANIKLIVIVSLAVVVIVGAVVGVRTYLQRRAVAATEQLGPLLGEWYQLSASTDSKRLKPLAGRLERFCASYGSTPAGMQGRMVWGAVLVRLGEYSKAVKVLEELADEPSLPKELKPLVLYELGVALEGKGEPGRAAQVYARAAEAGGPYLGRPWLLDQARALEAAGKKQEAADIYRRLAKAPERELAWEAKRHLALMGIDPEGGSGSGSK